MSKSKNTTISKNQQRGVTLQDVDQEVNRLLLREKKRSKLIKHFFLRFNATAILPANTANIVQVCAPVQGLLRSNRVGDVIALKRLRIRAVLVNASGVGADIYNQIRMVVFRWLGPTATSPSTATNLFEQIGATSSVINDNFSPFSIANRKLIDVILDEIVVTTLSPSPNSAVLVNKDIDLQDRKTIFDPAITTGTGLILVCFISDSLAAPDPYVSGLFDCTFQDAD